MPRRIGNPGSISASNPRPLPLRRCGIASRAVRASFKKLIDNPVFLLGIVAFLTALLLQSGELGSSDTTRRLQTTHSFWTSAPPVLPEEYPDFGIVGRKGTIYAWYGMGQSLLMLPADIIGTYLERDRKSTRLNSSHSSISYAVFCLKKKITNTYQLR